MKTLAYFNAKFLEPVDRFRGRNDVRYYLNGIKIEPSEKGGVNLIATDGHRIIAARDPDGYASEEMIFRADRSIVTAAKKKGAGRFYLMEGIGVVHNSLDPDEVIDNPLLPELDTAIGKVVHIDGKFPDWKRVTPNAQERMKEGAGSFFAMNLSYLTSVNGVFDAMWGGKYNGTQVLPPRTPTESVIFLPGTDQLEAIVVIMPMRVNSEKTVEGCLSWMAA